MTGDHKFKLHNGRVGAAITVHVTPRSKQNKITEILKDGTIHVYLTAFSDDQEINQSLIGFLSKTLGILVDDIEIIAGEHRVDKLVTILNTDPDTVEAKLTKHLK